MNNIYVTPSAKSSLISPQKTDFHIEGHINCLPYLLQAHNEIAAIAIV